MQKTTRIAFGLTTLFVGTTLLVPGDSEACGLKLTLRASKVPKKIKPSLNPSRVLVYGTPSRRLDKSLSKAGHRVEVSKDAKQQTGKAYDVVLVADASNVDAAKSLWPDAKVLAMSTNTRRNLAAVENAVTDRQPLDALARRTVVAQRQERAPVSAGPALAVKDSKRGALVASGAEAQETSEEAGAPKIGAGGGEGPGELTRAEPEAAEAKPAVLTSAARAEPALISAARVEKKRRPAKREVVNRKKSAPKPHIHFGLGSTRLSKASKRTLRSHAEWLTADASRKLVIEGHTDSVGSAQRNKMLSSKRAERAVKYLSRLGAPEDQVEIIAYGEEQPAFQPSTNPLNRRVTFVRQ